MVRAANWPTDRPAGREAEGKSAPSGEVRAQGNYKSAARLKKQPAGIRLSVLGSFLHEICTGKMNADTFLSYIYDEEPEVDERDP